MIEVKNLSIKSKDKFILKNINFSIKDGEKISILGKSGTGKSQLARAICKISKLELDGEIYIDNNKKYILGRDISMIFQDFSQSLNPVIKIKKQIFEIIKINPKNNKEYFEKEVLYYLNKLNLDKEILEKYPFELSGGQKQRIVILIILLLNPKVLICDEITSGLDPINEFEILNFLKSINKTIIMITHSINVIKNFSDKVIFLEDREIKFMGKLEDLFKIKNNDYIENLKKLWES